MNTPQLIDSFVEILQFVSLENTLVSPDDPLKVVVSPEYVDALDFEFAVTCFEATHRVSLDYSDLKDEDLEDLTITRLISDHLIRESRELSDPLFVTKRILIFKEALIEGLSDQSDEE